jgi:sugar-phosphatase
MAVIFDLDGVLVDSEPLWQEAETEAFAAIGRRLEPPLLGEARGLRIDQSVAYLLERAPVENVADGRIGADPEPLDAAALADRIVDRMVEMVRARGKALPGVMEALETLTGLGVPLAVASSSPLRLIEAVVARLGLEGCFEALCSAESEALGKPHPGVYLTSAAALGVDPVRCLAVEDSLPGVIAAKAARMRCLAVLEPVQLEDPRFTLADHRVASLALVDAGRWVSLVDGLSERRSPSSRFSRMHGP